MDKAPTTNGVMELTDLQKQDIKAKLQQIISDFIPSGLDREIGTHELVSQYNYANPDLLINGDTAEFLLGE